MGAHRAHLADGPLSLAVACSECHVVPQSVPGHAFGGPVVAFGALPSRGGASPSWDRSAATCSGVYCHGATLEGGTHTEPVWTRVGQGEAACGSCHGAPPASHEAFGDASDCHACHGDTVTAEGSIDLDRGKHVNGVLDFTLEGGGGLGCGLCHGAPPDTGAHRLHAGGVVASDLVYGDLRVREDLAAPGDGYAFGCGHCHPIDPALHLADVGGDGLADVVLAPPSPPVAGDDLKSRNAQGAAYDPVAKTCSGVACHSSGQSTPAYVTTPPWDSPPGVLGCDGCHADPPRYPSGGPGAADANSHLQLQADGYEWGHSGGLPGPWHGSKHGFSPTASPPVDAAPITCQACHAGSVDLAAGAGPSGAYWLDTTGLYTLPGGLLAYACGDCHGGAAGAPPTGAGRANPLRHVNGRRDVMFDARTTLPELPWLAGTGLAPTRPYWASGNVTVPAGAPGVEIAGGTVSIHLADATWDPATKTCSNVGCHLAQTSVVWGAPHLGFDACNACHATFPGVRSGHSVPAASVRP